MGGIFTGLLTVEEWHDYLKAIQQSFAHRQRRQVYAGLYNKLQAGQIIVADCGFFGGKARLAVVIEDFFDFNRMMDRIEDEYDPVVRIRFSRESELDESLAS